MDGRAGLLVCVASWARVTMCLTEHVLLRLRVVVEHWIMDILGLDLNLKFIRHIYAHGQELLA